MWIRIASSALLTIIAACTAGIETSTWSDGVPDEGVTDDGAARDDSGARTPDDPDAWSDECPDDAQDIYLLASGLGDPSADALLRFDPRAATLHRVGAIDCAAPPARPTALTIDREGHGWVLLSQSQTPALEVRRVELTTAQCASSGIPLVGDVLDDPVVSSLAFAAAPSGDFDELYVSQGFWAPRLFRADLTTGALSNAARLQQMTLATLTGNGGGLLFSLENIDPAWAGIRSIDVETGASELTVSLSTLVEELWATREGRWGAFGFAVWGDAFYVFTTRSGRDTSTAFRVTGPETYEVVLEDVGVLVAGAGVSTCAPYELF